MRLAVNHPELSLRGLPLAGFEWVHTTNDMGGSEIVEISTKKYAPFVILQGHSLLCRPLLRQPLLMHPLLLLPFLDQLPPPALRHLPRHIHGWYIVGAPLQILTRPENMQVANLCAFLQLPLPLRLSGLPI